jgi:hypothetical protein
MIGFFGGSKMRSFVLLVLTLVLAAAAPGAAQEIQVVERAFCLELERPNCPVPVVGDQIPISDLKTSENKEARLYFWSVVEVSADRSIVHVWTASHRPNPWAERVHVADKYKNLTIEILGHVRDFLFSRFQAEPDAHSVQGVVLPLHRSPRFRTYSSVRAVPGLYEVEIRDLNGNVLPGGEARRVTLLDP